MAYKVFMVIIALSCKEASFAGEDSHVTLAYLSGS